MNLPSAKNLEPSAVRTGTVIPRVRAAAKLAVSAPALAAFLVLFTLLSIGALQGLDVALNKPWSEWILPQWRPFVDDVLDPIASQAVALPILAVTATVLACRCRAWRPLLVAAAAELGVVGLVGTMKVVLARTSPVLEDPSFFHGGVFSHGGYGIIYPSGHAAQAVALYGVIVYLLSRYGSYRPATIRLLTWAVAAVAVMTMVSSLYLGWHWATDLVAGLLAGALVLRTTATVDQALPAVLSRQIVPSSTVSAPRSQPVLPPAPAYIRQAHTRTGVPRPPFVSHHS